MILCALVSVQYALFMVGSYWLPYQENIGSTGLTTSWYAKILAVPSSKLTYT